MEDWEQIVKGEVLPHALDLKETGVIRHNGLSSHNPQVAQMFGK